MAGQPQPFQKRRRVLQLEGIKLVLPCFPISFLSLIPIQKLNSFWPHPQPAMHTTFPPSVCTCFLSFPSFALRLPVHPQLSVLRDPHHGLLGPLHSPQLLLLQDQTALENVPFSQEEVVGPGEVCREDSCMPACGCRETQSCESLPPLHLEDYLGNSGRN